MTAPKRAALAAAFVLSAAGAAAGQRATALLQRIERADVDAPRLTDADDQTWRESRVCLERGAGAFVLAFRRLADSFIGFAAVYDEDGNDAGTSLAPLRDDERSWAWNTANIAGCVTVRTAGGRARLYRLTVGVNWWRFRS